MFKDEYKATFSKVTASQDTYRRVMNMTNEKKNRRPASFISKALIAAVIVSLLAVTASAAESGWIVRLFSRNSEMPLSEGQIQLIQEKEQPIQVAQTKDQWTVELNSAMHDGSVGYIVIHIRAPEGISLENQNGSRIDFGNPDILNEPVGVNTGYSAYWMDEGDGAENTMNFILEIFAGDELGDPFGEDALWNIHIDKILRTDGVETELLTEGIWDFDFCFQGEGEGIELLDTPIDVQADIPHGDFETEEMVRETIKITSFILRPLSAMVYYEAEAIPEFWFDGNVVKAVMKDGTTVPFMPGPMNWYDSGYYLMDAVLPIVLEDVDHILLSDGTKIPMPE